MPSASADGPRSETRPVTILSVPATHPVVCCFAGKITGLLTHHHQGRSSGCTGEAKCPSALHRARTVWKGYAPVRSWEPDLCRWAPAVLEVTECLEEMLRGRALVGEVWMLSRETARKRSGKVVGAYLETKTDAALLVPFDVLAPLLRLYHATELDLGVPNPLPAKLQLPTVEAAGPTLPNEAAAPEPTRITDAQREALRSFARPRLHAGKGAQKSKQ